MKILYFRTFATSFLSTCIGTAALAQNYAPNLEIHIAIPKLNGEEGSEPIETKEKKGKKKSALLSPCDLLTQQLTANKGPGITGAFKVTQCDANVADAPPNPKSATWKLSVVTQDNTKLVATMSHNHDGKWHEYSSFDINNSWMAPVVFSDEAAVNLIVLRIMDDMPFLGLLPASQDSIEEPIAVRPTHKSATLPAELVAYELSENKGVFVSRRIATYALSKDKKTYKVKKVEYKDVKHPIYLHDAKGPMQAGPLYLNKLNERQATLEKTNLLLDNFKAAHLGFRYGYSISKEKDPISKAPMIGIFSEFRRGILKGLRINYDTSPTATAIEDNVERTFGWKRLQLGYAATWAPKSFLVTRIDVMPRLGLMWLNIKGAAEDPDDPEQMKQFSFAVSKVPSFSLEIGLEKETKWSLIRAWVAQSIAVSLLQTDKSQKIVSTRSGIDFYRDISTINERFKIAGLVFGAFESSKITRDASKVSAEVEQGELALSNFQYQKTWAGLGVTITWW